jgi:hypothetical protein
VKDTPFERRTHESTGKHQGNLKRSLRDIQNNHEREERDKEKAKAEIDRLNKVVGNNAPEVAIGTGSAKGAAPVTTASVRRAAAGPLNAADQKRQWAQLADMGIEVPDSYRAEMAMASDWKAVPQPNQPRPDDAPADAMSIGVRKRKLDPDEQAQLEADGLPTVRKVWGRDVRHFPGETGDDGLEDLLAGKTFVKKQKPDVDVKQEPAAANEASVPSDTAVDSQTLDVTANPVEASSESIPLVKSETAAADDQPTATPIFKKRKGKQAPK